MKLSTSVFICVLFVGAFVGPAAAQDQSSHNTTDKHGFEKPVTAADMLHQTATQLMSAGEYDKAASSLERVVAMDPGRLGAWQDLGNCYNHLKEFKKAANAFMKAHELAPDNAALLSNLGYSQLNAKSYDMAKSTYEKMIAIDPASYDANVHLAFVLQREGDKLKASIYYEKALAAKPKDVATLGSLANLYAELGETDKSVATYERAIAAADVEQKKVLQSKLGRSLIDAKKWQKAADVYASLVKLSPENAAFQFNLGISLMQANHKKEAATHLSKTIELRPDYAQAYQYLASCYNDTGRYEKAIATIKQGLPKADNKAGLYVTWGRSLEKEKRFDEAIEMFQRAVHDPRYGGYAKKQIARQIDLKKREKMMKNR